MKKPLAAEAGMKDANRLGVTQRRKAGERLCASGALQADARASRPQVGYHGGCRRAAIAWCQQKAQPIV